MRRRVAAVALSALVLAACQLADEESADGEPTWVDAWQAAPAGTVPNACAARPAVTGLVAGAARNQTLRMTLRASTRGSHARLRLSNRFSDEPLIIKHVTLARRATGAAITPGTILNARFDGRRDVTIPPGADATSDPINISVDPDRALTVSIAVHDSSALTWHPIGPETTYVSRAGSGDRTLDLRGTAFTARLRAYPVLAGLEVRAPKPTTAIVAFGDSLTEGGAGTPDSNWVEVLGERLRDARRPFTVVNAGITCNSLLRGNDTIGPKGSDRFQADVVDRVGASHVVLFLGTNDLGAPASAIIDALRQLARRARAAGIKPIGATLLPSDRTVRATVNRWIRTTTELDGYIDFDAVVRSKSNPAVMNPRYRADAIHPNARGHVAMGNAIKLSLFE